MPRLVADHLTFRYPGSPAAALDDISLDIDAGEMILVAGPSGCGKSTLALALSGMIPTRVLGRTSGFVQIDGAPLASLEPYEIAARVGMVYQDPSTQLVTPTVEYEVAFGPENLGLQRPALASRVDEALRLTGMDGHRRAVTTSLSGGEKQRVAIAATLAMGPDILILDEPCSDLDPEGAQDILRVLRTLNRERGMTIILIEHRIDEVAPWVDRVVLMDNGRIALDGDRSVFAQVETWQHLGLTVPEMVQIGRAFPDYFRGGLPLSVNDAVAGLSGSPVAGELRRLHVPPGSGDRDAITALASRNAAPVMQWNHVALSYEGRAVLRDVTLDAQRGEWLTIAGSNGSGKTSMVELAMGFRRPTSGAVSVNGVPSDPDDVSRQAQQVGYLFQQADTMLFTSLVVKELEFSQKYRGHHAQQTSSQLQERLETLLELIGLSERRDTDPFMLSMGQRERLAIAALLTDAPDALILDEPTTGQDEAHSSAILGFLADLRRESALTYVMITHDMRAVARYATRLAVVHDGGLLAVGAPATVFARPDLERAHIIAPPVAELHRRLAPGVPKVCLTVPELLSLLGTPAAREVARASYQGIEA